MRNVICEKNNTLIKAINNTNDASDVILHELKTNFYLSESFETGFNYSEYLLERVLGETLSDNSTIIKKIIMLLKSLYINSKIGKNVRPNYLYHYYAQRGDIFLAIKGYKTAAKCYKMALKYHSSNEIKYNLSICMRFMHSQELCQIMSSFMAIVNIKRRPIELWEAEIREILRICWNPPILINTYLCLKKSGNDFGANHIIKVALLDNLDESEAIEYPNILLYYYLEKNPEMTIKTIGKLLNACEHPRILGQALFLLKEASYLSESEKVKIKKNILQNCRERGEYFELLKSYYAYLFDKKKALQPIVFLPEAIHRENRYLMM